jgi:hypothetical protein
MTCLTALLLAVSALSLRAAGNPVQKLEAHNVKASVVDASDQEFLMLGLTFDATFVNQTGSGVQVAQKPIFLTSVDRLVAPEGWRLLQTSSYYPTDGTKVEACRTVSPGEKFDFFHIPAVATLKKADIRASSRIQLRFHLDVVCMQGSGAVTQPLVTGQVEVEVPNW